MHSAQTSQRSSFNWGILSCLMCCIISVQVSRVRSNARSDVHNIHHLTTASQRAYAVLCEASGEAGRVEGGWRYISLLYICFPASETHNILILKLLTRYTTASVAEYLYFVHRLDISDTAQHLTSARYLEPSSLDKYKSRVLLHVYFSASDRHTMGAFNKTMLLFIWIANGFSPGSSGTAIRRNTKIHVSHKIAHRAQTQHTKLHKYLDILNMGWFLTHTYLLNRIVDKNISQRADDYIFS
jgi:hypothetical protein